MCELLALSSSLPVRLTFSLRALAARGGGSGGTGDGWGVAFYQGPDVALFREPAAAADSPLVHFLESHGPATDLALSHIRHATRGAISLANTQPFVRELGGQTHAFAHNGDLPGIFEALAPGRYHPVGQTDSEHAFCVLLERLRGLWRGSAPPGLEDRLSLVAEFAADLRALGPANFLYADGEVLFAHAHRRKQTGKAHPEPPGLWMRQGHCTPDDPVAEQQTGVSLRPTHQTVVWLASVPLAGDGWRSLEEGEVVAVRGGELLGRRLPRPAVP